MEVTFVTDWRNLFLSTTKIKALVIIIFAGGDSLEVTPDPIPNSEVKVQHVDGTA